MKNTAGIILASTLLVLAPASTYALGLGDASGQAILGAPLRIEIALIGSEAGIPELECFTLRPPQTVISSTYVLRQAQLQVLGEDGRARLLLTSALPMQEPVLEFAVAVGCGFGLSKDYLLLTEAPGGIAAPELPAGSMTSPELPPARTRPPAAALPLPPAGENSLRVANTLRLAALAKQKYPLQPKAREKFIRMMVLANPGLESGDSLVENGTELQLPPGLPLRRLASRATATRPAKADSAASMPALPPPAVGKSPDAAARPQRDLLVLGAPAERSLKPVELLAEAERLAAILLEQTKTQDALLARIAKLDDTLIEFRTHIIGLTDRIHRIEAERQAERLAAKPASLDFVELLLAVLAGGLIGASSLYLFNRRQSQREFQAAPFASSASSAMPSAAAPAAPSDDRMDFNLPWKKAPAAENRTDPPAADDPGAAAGSAPKAQDDFDFSLTAPLPRPDLEMDFPQTSKKALP